MIGTGSFFRHPDTHQGPPKTREELIHRLDSTLLGLDAVDYIRGPFPVCDRFGLFSEQIYGTLLRNCCVLTAQDILNFEHEIQNAIILYCRPSLRTISSIQLESKPHKDLDHTNSVIKQRMQIIAAYDYLMFEYECKGFNIIRYNRDITGTIIHHVWTSLLYREESRRED